MIDLPTWVLYHKDSLVLSNSCALISSSVSSICLLMVLLTVVAKSSQQTSSGGTISSLVEKDFMALAMNSVTKSYAISTSADHQALYPQKEPTAQIPGIHNMGSMLF